MAKTYNDALEWAAKWIEDTLRAGPETNERTVEFGTNMAMTLRAAKLSSADLPHATAETTIEQCLAELREMLPDSNWRFHVGFGMGQPENAPYSVVFYEGQWVKDRYESNNLSELMTQVRAAAQTKQESGEK